MRVLLLLPYAWDTAPSQRFRIEQWRSRLEARGVDFRIEALLTRAEQYLLYSPAPAYRKGLLLGRSLVRRLYQLRNVQSYDAIWLHRAVLPVGPPLLERLLLRQRVPLILEFDDAIFLTHLTQSNRRWGFLKYSGMKTATLCRLSAHVVVGNDYLADYARQFNDSVSVVPTTIDTDAYRPRERYPDSSPVVIGWSGSHTTVGYLRNFDPVIRRVASLIPIKLHVIGTPEYQLDGVTTYATEWTAPSEIAELSRFDIGVMPMPNAEWARGKCGLKALQYMGLGIPTLASPVGVNSEIIDDGENGYLPRTEDEWVERLLTLARSVRLRDSLGRAGRRTVEERYSVDVAAARVYGILEEVCERKGRQRVSQEPGAAVNRP
jgi:glycosyltransferase involved in cell wall biosynthesis